jgi:hypothetical protein
MDPGEYKPKVNRQGQAKDESAQFEQWADDIANQKTEEETTTEAKIKPYVSMYQGDGGKTVYDVLNGDGESAMKTLDGEQAEIFLKQNYDKLKTGTPEKQPILSKPYPGSAMLGQHPKSEGNEFAQAVQKAKAAGMKSGDKFKVGDKEYTLKDAIELAGLNLNEFFQEEETEVKESISESKADNTASNIAGVDDEVTRIVNLSKYQ